MAKAKPKSNLKLYLGLGVLLLVGAYFYGGDSSTPTTTNAAAATKKTKSGPSDLYQPIDYTATYPVLKVQAKNAFLPLVHKAIPVGGEASGPSSIPSYLTGGGDWSYDGSVENDGRTQALLDEVKTGESDFVALGAHWKHARLKKISDSEIVLQGDNGESATVKMGESTASSSKSSPAITPAAVQPPPLAGNLDPSATMDITPLPGADQGNGNGGGRGRGRGGRGGRRGGGFGMFNGG